MIKTRWLSALLALLLLASLGCGSTISTSGSARGFSNTDTARGLILSLLSLLDGLRPLGLGPSASASVNRVCPLDGEHFNVYYELGAATAPVLTSYTAASENAHFILLGTAADPCTLSQDDTTELFSLSLNGKSSALHSPDLRFVAEANGTVEADTSFSGTILVWYDLDGQNLCSGTLTEDFEGEDVALLMTVMENNAFGGTGRMILEYQPSSLYFQSHVIGGKPGVGRITISGTTRFNGEYFFNEDYAFDSSLSRIS